MASSERRGDDGWALAELASRLSAAVDPAAIGEELIAVLVPAFCDAVEFVVPGEDGRLWRVASGPGSPEERRRQPVPDIADHPVRLAALYGQAQRIDIDEPSQRHLFGPADVPTSAAAMGIRNALVLPLTGTHGPFGAVALANGPSGRGLDDHDERFGAVAANLAGLALERAQALAAHERATAMLEDAARIGTALAGAGTVDDVAAILVEAARDRLGAPRGMVYAVDPTQLTLLAASGYPADRLDGWRSVGRELPVPVADAVRGDDELRRDDLLVVTGIDAIREQYPSVAALEGFADQTMVCAVARGVGGRHLAVAFWSFDGRRHLDDAERRFVVVVADQAGAAIERIRLAEQRASVAAALEASASDLASARSRLQALADAGVIGIISGEGDRIVEVNEAFVRLLGYTALDAQAGTLRWPDITPPEWAEVDRRVVDEMLVAGRAEPFEKEYFHRDGRRVPVMVGGVTLSVDPFRWVVFVADVTARREAERRAELARAQLERLLAEQRRITETLQTSLLPAAVASVPGMEIRVASWPARAELDIGGDCYDVFPLPDGRWALMVADVCGKGAEAASVTAAVRHSLRTAALHAPDPVAVLTWVHEAIRAYPIDTFCAVTYAVLDARGDEPVVDIVVAGQDAALAVARDGTTRDVGSHGSVLGMYPPRLASSTAVLQPGELLVVYTDGVTDAPGPQAMTRAELAALVRRNRDAPLADIEGAVRDALAARRPHGALDDVVLLLLRGTGQTMRLSRLPQ